MTVCVCRGCTVSVIGTCRVQGWVSDERAGAASLNAPERCVELHS